jgi:predicted RNase H-like HicB family nuclease
MPTGMKALIRIELEREDDGRWLAEAVSLPGVLTYGATVDEALEAAKGLALQVLGDRIQHHEEEKQLDGLDFSVAFV